jgi:hypothetical protein
MRGVPGGALERGLVVEDDVDRRGLEQRAQAALVIEGVEEDGALHLGQNLGRDAAADVDAAEGEHFQREVARLRAVVAGEAVERIDADGVLARQPGLGYHRAEIAPGQLLGEPFGFGLAGALAKEAVEIFHAHAGENALPTHVAVFLAQEHEELVADAVVGCEAGVTALAGKGAVVRAVQKDTRFAQAGASGDERAIAGLMQIGVGVEGKQFFRQQGADAIGIGLEIVEQADALEFQFRLQRGSIDGPGQIGYLNDATLDRTGHAEAGMPNLGKAVAEKAADDIRECATIFARVGFEFFRNELFVVEDVKSQVGFGTADIACEKHRESDWWETARMWSGKFSNLRLSPLPIHHQLSTQMNYTRRESLIVAVLT